MMHIRNIAAVTAGQLQKKIDTISNNIANVHTTGYKRRETSFSDLLFQQLNNQSNPNVEVGRLTPHGLRVGSGARVASTAIRLEQGPIIETERELDFAIAEKNRFFRVGRYENGEIEPLLTRDGAFYLSVDPDDDTQLVIVNKNGDYLLNGAFEPIAVPVDFKTLSLTEEGVLMATLQDGTVQNLGQLALTHVHKPQLLETVGDNLFRIPDLVALGYEPEDVYEEVPGDEGLILQGKLEGSNVNLANEMTQLIETQRHYQFMTRAISIADEMASIVNNIRR